MSVAQQLDGDGITIAAAAGLLGVAQSTVRGFMFNNRIRRTGERRVAGGHILALVSQVDVDRMVRQRKAKEGS